MTGTGTLSSVSPIAGGSDNSKFKNDIEVPEDDKFDDDYEHEYEHQPFFTKVKLEIPALLRLAGPVVIYYLGQALPGFVNVIFMGSLGTEELAGAALGYLFANVTGFSLIWGLSTGLDTLCTQAYGAKAYHRVGALAQRAFLILCLTCLVIASIWMNADAILLSLGQKPRAVELAGLYCKILIASLPPMCIFATIQKYLQAQHIVVPILVISLIANSINILLMYLLVRVAGLGFIGAPITVTVTYYIFAILGVLYVVVSGVYKKTWPGFTRDSLHEWGQYLKFAIPGCLMICLEWYAYELSALLAGTLGEIELSTFAVILQIWTISFMVPLGMSVAISIRVGNHLGSGSASRARYATVASFLVTGVWVVIAASLLLGLRLYVPWGFTSDRAITTLVSLALYFIVPSQILDSLQALSSGVLRGLGKQAYGAVVNFIGFYVIGLPSSVLFVFYAGFGVLGCVYGLIVGLGVQVILLIIVLRRSDWIDAAKRARLRATATATATVDGGEGGGEGEGNEMEMHDIEETEEKEEKHSYRCHVVSLSVCLALFVTGLVSMLVRQ